VTLTKSFALAEVKSAQTDDPNGAFEAILSAPTLDRDGEIIDAKAFDPLPEHITIDMDHGLSMATTVGSGRPFYDGDVLKVRGTFSSIPRAQEARALVAEGHIRTMSVAFTRSEATKAADGEPPHIKRGELLNAAFVAVPSNRDALVLSAKAMDDKAGARNSKSDAELIQSMHDNTASLGADCSGMGKSFKDVNGPDDDPAKLAAAVDAALDEVVTAMDEGDMASAMDLLTAAQATVDSLLTAMGVADADEVTRSVKPEGAAAKAAASPPADADQDDLSLRARTLSLVALSAAS